MNALQIFVIFLMAFMSTLVYIPKFIEKAYAKKFIARDMYKENAIIPTMGGLTIFTGTICAIIIALLILGTQMSERIVLFYFTIIVFALFGFADDLFTLGHMSKILIPFGLALPIAAFGFDTKINLIFATVDLGEFYTFIIAPVYVMVVANLVNMHSGYNGLSAGLSYIVLSFLIIRVFIESGFDNVLLIMPLFGSLLAFLYFNTYPAKLFWGNIGSLMVGSAIGSFIIVNKLEVFGMILMFPHIVNFLMYVVWKIKKLGNVKFGRIREDNTLDVPNPWTLKWTFPYFFRLTEHQTMWILYFITTVFGFIGLIAVPYV